MHLVRGDVSVVIDLYGEVWSHRDSGSAREIKMPVCTEMYILLHLLEFRLLLALELWFVDLEGSLEQSLPLCDKLAHSESG